MNLNFKPVEAEDLEKLNPFFCKRPNKTCDSVFLDSFIWREYYNVRYAVSDNKAILWLMDLDGKTGSAMPICSEAKNNASHLQISSNWSFNHCI